MLLKPVKSKSFAQRAATPIEQKLQIARAEAKSVPFIESTDLVIKQESVRANNAAAQPTKLSRLTEDDFPFDDSQMAAIEGITQEQFACLMGAAGTGKTTVTKAVVDRIQEQMTLSTVNMGSYFKSKMQDETESDSDDFTTAIRRVPAIAMCAFTGRASQMIKRNFPLDWHQNITTIHRLLGYYPEEYTDIDGFGNAVTKMKFVPYYEKKNPLPWDVVVIDEAGMLGLDLWHELFDALKPGCRVIMIGDINQLPPVHGRSIFGFALANWPVFELTTIHRQEGENNSIVDNAWRILQGHQPQPDDFANDPDWKFYMAPVNANPDRASVDIRGWLMQMRAAGMYDEIRDTIITPGNGDKPEAAGFALCQIPLNRDLAIRMNENSDRYVIDAGIERREFAVGDKVMATQNDHENQITNGMQGIITGIKPNGNYKGNKQRFGKIQEVREYLKSIADENKTVSLEELMAKSAEIQARGVKQEKSVGSASHIVTVNFGTKEKPHEHTFSTQREVGTLMISYAVTCHKMQGGEAPMVIIILHQSHARMLSREWLYTAITRASQRCIVLYTPTALHKTLYNQKIKGKTLAEKINEFQKLQAKGNAFGVDVVKVKLQTARKWKLIPEKGEA